MLIKRNIIENITKRLFKRKAIIIVGARQVGKTTLVLELAKSLNIPFLYWNCDEADVQEILKKPTSTFLKQEIGNNKLLIIDEGQRIADIGITSKLIVDQIPDVQLILTGSSSLDIANVLNEPLTGRKFEYLLFPFSFAELTNNSSLIEERRLLKNRIIYGYYPEVICHPGDEEDRLLELCSSYMYKDIFSLGNIKKPVVLDNLTKALALQIGNEVSLNELSLTVGIDKNTVSKYIDLLEKSFITFSLHSLSRNQRNELKKSRKIYFWDTGIRNSLIKHFNPLELRNDKGSLWENFIISERLKYLNNSGKKVNYYFWRTFQKQEVDYIEEYGGKLHAYEMKWNPKKKSKLTTAFLKVYPDSDFKNVNSDNYIEFISE